MIDYKELQTAFALIEEPEIQSKLLQSLKDIRRIIKELPEGKEQADIPSIYAAYKALRIMYTQHGIDYTLMYASQLIAHLHKK